MNNPEISIIVPVYNVELYLRKCIESILEQTFKNFELIIVNDGSTDNSGIICKEYRKIDPRIKIIHKFNNGLSSARNTGIEIAKGKYIGFIDSDDYINKYMFEILYENITKNNADISMCDYMEVYKDKNEIYCEKQNSEKLILNNIESLEKIYDKEGWKYIIVWNKLYKKVLFSEVRFPVGKIHEDEMIVHEILYKAKKLVFDKSKLYYYLQRDNSIMSKKDNIQRLDIVEAMKNRADFFYNNNLRQLQYKAEYEYLKIFFKLYFKYINSGCKWNMRIKELKKAYNSMVFRLLKNPNYNIKEKVMLILFYISPDMYIKFIK